MQQHLHQSLRSLCRQQCRRRLHSAQAAVRTQRTPEIHTDFASNSTSADRKLTARTECFESSGSLAELDGIATGNKPIEPPWSSGPFSAPNKVDTYLASLRAGGIEPTLEDLFRLSPKQIPSAKASRYASEYLNSLDRLCRTFSKSQLRRFCQELRLEKRYSKVGRKKTEYAEAIMEQYWGWENLKDVEMRKRDASEVVAKSYPVSASELFLLLGKDGSELLQISREYNVHIAVSPDPLSIQIEGFKGSIRKLGAMIADRRKSIIRETIELPTAGPLSPSLLQQVSRMANAFIENPYDKGKVRITANDQSHLIAAKRLVVRAAVEVKRNFCTPYSALLPPPPSALAVEDAPSYTLFPFAAQRTLVWTNTTGHAFRARQINDWLDKSSKRLASFSADLSGRRGQLLCVDGEMATLESIINRSFGDAGGPYTISASTGHVLLVLASHRRSNILPPLMSHRKHHELMDWMKKNIVQRVFLPCLPSPLLSAPPTQERVIHRLTYRHVQRKHLNSRNARQANYSPVKVINAEVIINRQKLEELGTTVTETDDLNPEERAARSELEDLIIDDSEGANDSRSQVLGDDFALDVAQPLSSSEGGSYEQSGHPRQTDDYMKQECPEDVKRDDISMAADSGQSAGVFDGDFTCRKGQELELLVSLPDRPMDLKLSVLGSVDCVSVHEMPEIGRYFEALKAYLGDSVTETTLPEPPLFTEYDGDRYILHSNASVRQSAEFLATGRHRQLEFGTPLLDGTAERRIATTTESSFELESGQKVVGCQISCETALSDGAWASFLENIDQISCFGFTNKQIPSDNNFVLASAHSPDEASQLQ